MTPRWTRRAGRRTGLLGRLGLTVVLASFGLTGPGLAGLELAAHLAGFVDLEHERRPHVEPSGQAGHTDHCQLGVTALDGRLPADRGPILRDRAASWRRAGSAPCVPLAAGRRPAALPRAPPA